jgi:mannitol-specific phosphotransferase system IIBC component
MTQITPTITQKWTDGAEMLWNNYNTVLKKISLLFERFGAVTNTFVVLTLEDLRQLQ